MIEQENKNQEWMRKRKQGQRWTSRDKMWTEMRLEPQIQFYMLWAMEEPMGKGTLTQIKK